MKRTAYAILISMIFVLSVSFIGCGNPLVSGAKVSIQQNNYDKAIEQCLQAIEQEPDNAEAYYVMGNAYFKKSMFKEMNDAFIKSLAIGDKFNDKIESHRELAWNKLFESGVTDINEAQYEKAAEKFEVATQIKPERVSAYNNLAYVYNQLDQPEKAKDTYIRALAVDSTDMEIKYYLGVLYYNTKNYEACIETMNEVLENTEPGSELYNNSIVTLAIAYDLSGNSDKAIETYDNALKVNPTDKDILFNKGRLYFLQKDYENAAKVWQRVIEIDPDDFEAHLNIANSYINVGDSLKNEQRNQNDKMEYIHTEEERAELQERYMEQYSKAIPLLEKAAQLQPENPNVWQVLGYVYYWSDPNDKEAQEKSKNAFDKADALAQ